MGENKKEEIIAISFKVNNSEEERLYGVSRTEQITISPTNPFKNYTKENMTFELKAGPDGKENKKELTLQQLREYIDARPSVPITIYYHMGNPQILEGLKKLRQDMNITE